MIKGYFPPGDGGGSALLPHQQIPNPPRQQSSRFFQSSKGKIYPRRKLIATSSILSSTAVSRKRSSNVKSRSTTSTKQHRRSHRSATPFVGRYGQNGRSSRAGSTTTTSNPLGVRRSKYRSAEVECAITLAEGTSKRMRKQQYNRPMTTSPRAATSLGKLATFHTNSQRLIFLTASSFSSFVFLFSCFFCC